MPGRSKSQAQRVRPSKGCIGRMWRAACKHRRGSKRAREREGEVRQGAEQRTAGGEEDGGPPEDVQQGPSHREGVCGQDAGEVRLDHRGSEVLRRAAHRLRLRGAKPEKCAAGLEGTAEAAGGPVEDDQQESDEHARQGGIRVRGPDLKAQRGGVGPRKDREGDWGAGSEEEPGAADHVDQSKPGLRQHLQHAPARGHRKTGAPRGLHGVSAGRA
mmetsp:Transcript_48694/g.97965  ORF Transcript_48694/g.97965 Transcript_48694/m.97965 type:complete len:215 (+) Transcript_48694:755-1399(+)